jgi:O-antigen ligase
VRPVGNIDSRRLVSLAVLLCLPFWNSPIVNPNIAGIHGLKPLTILVAVALVLELSRQPPWKFRDSIERRALAWYLLYLCAFLVVFARSIPHLPTFHAEMPDQFQDSTVDYVLSFFARPALSTCLFALIIRQFQSDSEIDRVVRTMRISMAVLSITVLTIILATPDLYTVRRDMAVTLQRYLGLHYNSVGTIYILTCPILVALALEDGLLPKLNAMLAVLVIATIQSRSSVLIFWLQCLVLLWMTRKGLSFLAMNLLATGVLLHWTAPTLSTVQARTLSPHAQALDWVLSGRIGFLWAPLLSEWSADPARLLWGAGRYGILVSSHFGTGDIVEVTHAHNAFIDLFLDTGVVGVIIVVLLLAAGLARVWRVGRSIRDPTFWALALSLAGYLAATLTERGFFPSYDNLLVFPIVALLVNVARVRRIAIAADVGDPSAEQPAHVRAGATAR